MICEICERETGWKMYTLDGKIVFCKSCRNIALETSDPPLEHDDFIIVLTNDHL